MSRLVAWIKGFALALGGPGLFIIGYLDSSFLSFPELNDLLLMGMVIEHKRRLLYYAFMATAGSAVGCWLLYVISRRAGARALNRFSERKQARVKNLIERYDMVAVLVATLLPPPFPFKLFVVTAGVFRFSLLRFMLAIIVGRAFRFLLEGYFAVRYGAQAKEILAKYYPWIGIGLVVGIIVFVLLRQKLKRPEIVPDHP